MAFICREMVMHDGISIKYGFTSRTQSGDGAGFPDRTTHLEQRRSCRRSAMMDYLRPAAAVGLPAMVLGVSVLVALVGGVSGVTMAGMVGIIGVVVLDPVRLANGDTLGVGMVAQELTPRLGISQESRGIPTLGLPPGVVGVVEVGVDGEATLDPVPHVPVTPTVTDVADIPTIDAAVVGVEVIGVEISAVCVLPDVCELPDVAVVLVMAVVPADAAVEVVADPIAIPPPS